MRIVFRSFLVVVTISLGCNPAARSPAAESDQATTQDQSSRQATVAARGSAVMPFDLDTSTHVFEKTARGGLQQVVSDIDDSEQVALTREHLQEEAERFSRGDFHDPVMIHGDDMAGLHELVMGHDRIVIEYSEIDAGAQILYTSEDPDLVAAIHAWFDAQVGDHGEHAQSHR
jgi:hypothetical protein